MFRCFGRGEKNEADPPLLAMVKKLRDDFDEMVMETGIRKRVIPSSYSTDTPYAYDYWINVGDRLESAERKLDLIAEHLGLEFGTEKAKPERLVLKKKRLKK